jgi:hypothetical protein
MYAEIAKIDKNQGRTKCEGSNSGLKLWHHAHQLRWLMCKMDIKD